MVNELKKLEKYLKNFGKTSAANEILKLKKIADFPPSKQRELTEKILLYRKALKDYGFDDDTIVNIRKKNLPADRADEFLEGKIKLTPALRKKIRNDAGNFVFYSDMYSGLYQKNYKEPEPMLSDVLHPETGISVEPAREGVEMKFVDKLPPVGKGRVAPAETAPAERRPQAAPARSIIVRENDPYTYSHNPSGPGYVVVSGPKGRGVGAVIAPGTEGYDLIRADDPNPRSEEGAEKTTKEKAKETLTEEPSPWGALPEEAPEEESEPVKKSIINLNPAEKYNSLLNYFRETEGTEEAAQVKLQEIKTDLANGKFKLTEAPSQPSGRRIALIDLEHDLPIELRYDGVFYDEKNGQWVAGDLTRKEVRALGIEDRLLKRELRRERRQYRRDERGETRKQRRIRRLREKERRQKERRAKASRKTRKILLEQITKKAVS